MTHKILFGSALAIAMAFGANVASACSVDAWSVRNNVTAADAGDPSTGFKRYSGRCGLRVNAANKFVQDNTPNNETSYRARFYFFTADVSGGEIDIFQAKAQGGTNIIRVTHDGSLLRFYVNTGGAAQQVTVQDNKYYAIEMAWAAGTTSPATTGTFTATVKGAGSAAAAGTANFTGLANAADSITDARLGVMNGTPTFAGGSSYFFDEFDSRRTTDPGRLCRGDADNNNAVNVFDIGAMVPEIQQPANPAVLTQGQPDFDENGSVNVFDVGAMVPAIQANTQCSAL